MDHAGPTDRDLLQAAREGKEEAARRLLVEDAPTMLRTAWHVLGRYGGSEVEDVVQEAFLAALTTTALPRGRPRGEASLDRGEKGPRSDTQGEVAQ